MEATTANAREATQFPALNEETVCAALQRTAADNPDREALRTQGGAYSITWSEYADAIEKTAGGLAALGLGGGDTIALMLNNRPEFHIFDSAAMHLGATPFSIYNTYSPEQIEYLAGDAAVRIVVTETAYLDTIQKVRQTATGIEHVIVVDGDGTGDILTMEDVQSRTEDGFDFEASWKAVEPDDILTLIYTSGTTGPPKGVQITHHNLMSLQRAFYEMAPTALPEAGRVVSYLPMAHIAERGCSHYLPVSFGGTVTCCPDARAVIGYLPEVRPTFFFAVPRIWEKLKSALEAGMAAEEDEQKKQATQWALGVAMRKVEAEQAGEEVPPELAEEHAKADAMVLSKMREKLGFDKVEMVLVGAAPTPAEVLKFFHAIGVPIAEVWGMSETTGMSTMNPPGAVKIGTVGLPAPGLTIELAEDGEVLVKGEMVMKGYRNQPDKTRETIDDDGWLHTGDIGEFDEDGYLKIVDRKKELIISAAGKNMSPANIEARVKSSSPLIGQAVAIGDAKPYNTALIVLDPDAAPMYAKKLGLSDPSPGALAGNEQIVAEVQKGIDQANEQLARVEQIKKFKILPEDWEPGGDELTPTMKLKRKPIGEKYAEEIAGLYDS